MTKMRCSVWSLKSPAHPAECDDSGPSEHSVRSPVLLSVRIVAGFSQVETSSCIWFTMGKWEAVPKTQTLNDTPVAQGMPLKCHLLYLWSFYFPGRKWISAVQGFKDKLASNIWTLHFLWCNSFLLSFIFQCVRSDYSFVSNLCVQ